MTKLVLKSLLRYACPLFVPGRGRQSVEHVGTAVPFAAGRRHFLLTAGHVVEDHAGKGFLYPSAERGEGGAYLSREVVSWPSRSLPSEDGHDPFDFGIIEIPPGALAPNYAPVPQYMVAQNITLKHVDEVTLIGYPATKNKLRFAQRAHTPRGIAFTGLHARAEYDGLGLNPVTHFCVRFNPERCFVDGHRRTPPALYGMSGGPAWAVPESAVRSGSDEGVMLLGLTAQSPPPRGTLPERNVVWGPRMSYVLGSVRESFAELAPHIARPKEHLTRDPEEVRYFRAVQRRV